MDGGGPDVAGGWAAPALRADAGAGARSPAAADKKEEEKPKTFWEEHQAVRLHREQLHLQPDRRGRDATNELRFYDYDEGYTFNMAEFSIKKDPSERYWFGYRPGRHRRPRRAEEPLARHLPWESTTRSRSATRHEVRPPGGLCLGDAPARERPDAQGR